jgi:glutathionyl-hydroquinone reductase
MSSTSQSAAHSFRGRIGPDASSGFYATPHRYELHLTLSCPDCLRIAITYDLLHLQDRVRLTLLSPIPDETGGGYAALRPAYEATRHRCGGPAGVPVLADRWTGRIVSNHAPHILWDLATRFRDDGPELCPPRAADEIEMVAELCEQGITEAAQQAGQAGPANEKARHRALDTLLAVLCALEDRLSGGRPFVLGDTLSAADVYLWVALVRLDTVHRWHLDADAVHRVAAHPQLWAYAHRLLAEPAFRGRLRLGDIARRHRHECRGLEAAGAAVQIIDWTTSGVPAPAPHHH